MRSSMILIVAALLVAFAAPVSAVSRNDDFAAAMVLEGTQGEVHVDTVGATDEAGEPQHAGAGTSAVWFRFTTSTFGPLTLDTGGSGFDTVIAAYEGSAVNRLREIGADDDAADGRPDPLTSRLEVWVAPFEPVSIAVAGLPGEQGTGRLVWAFSPAFDAGVERPSVEATRIDAGDTVETALALSRLTFGDRGSPSALLARADVFADTLAGGALAGGQPLLLTPGDTLHDGVGAELERIDARQVVVLGGSSAIDDAVLEQLAERGIDAHRVAGPTRIETAVSVAERVVDGQAPSTALLARAFPAGEDPTQAFADSIAAGAWAADQGWPVLLTATGSLSAPTAAHLAETGYDRVIIIGGEAAVSSQVADEVAGLVPAVERVAGLSRDGTALAIAAARGATGADAVDEVVVVDGVSAGAWAGGLAAASYSAIHDAPVLLAATDRLPPATVDFLRPSPDADAVSGVCVASDAACAELEGRLALVEADGVRCDSTFEHAGYTGCHSEIGGLEVKFFPLPEGTRVQRLAIYFHGDRGNDWVDPAGFNQAVLDWAYPRDVLVLGFKAPSTHDSLPYYSRGDEDTASTVAGAIAHFATQYGVAEQQALYWGQSGGAVFLSFTFIPTVGNQMPGVFALHCGGGFRPLDYDWRWDPRSDTAARDLIALLFNYGDQDFLAESIADSHVQYQELGFSSQEIVHPGAAHCEHPQAEPTVQFWDAHLR